MTAKRFECRYSEYGDEWNMDVWMYDEAGRVRRSELVGPTLFTDRPEWLTRILNIAHAGGHGIIPQNPPPNFIMWFTTDSDKNLLEFDPTVALANQK